MLRFQILAVFLLIIGCGNNAKFGIAEKSQSFGQRITYNTQVDLLLVVDNSGSMGSKQAQLASGFVGFIDYLVASQFDFRIAITTMDMSSGGAKGNFVGNPKVLSKSTPDLRNAFINNMNLGTNGSDLSRGFEAMQSSLSDSKLNGTNSGFFREEALLAIIFMSDEDDNDSSNWQNYADFLDNRKPMFPWGYRGWLVNSIVVKELSNKCLTYNQFASAGYGFMNLSNISEGIIESICEADLVGATANLRARIAEILTQFHLNREPDVATIRVYINGVLIPQDPVNGWTYNPVGYTILFHGNSVPAANANVTVSFTPKSIKN
ncbi:MAG: VWA domain-containing protein [Oligoflexia bacterium]|nr:VWA domain-containing protein [Oligoflexia bacterium]